MPLGAPNRGNAAPVAAVIDNADGFEDAAREGQIGGNRLEKEVGLIACNGVRNQKSACHRGSFMIMVGKLLEGRTLLSEACRVDAAISRQHYSSSLPSSPSPHSRPIVGIGLVCGCEGVTRVHEAAPGCDVFKGRPRHAIDMLFG